MKRLFAPVIFLGILLTLASPLKADEAGPPPLLSQDGNKIISLDIKNEIPSFPVISFFVRYPKGLSPGDKVQGVFAYVIYLSDKTSLQNWIETPSSNDVYFKFADEHKLALITWTTTTMYSISNSFTLDSDDEREPSNGMEQCFRTWEIGIKEVCRHQNLPDSGFLMYGLSRGAQWAHRIALRDPARFIAIQIHVNSSFAEPTPDASHCLWLLTTGELEHGSQAARVFYQKALALNYPILLRIFSGKGHEAFPEEMQLGLKFFDYALKLKARQLALNSQGLQGADSPIPEDKPLIFDDSLLKDFRQSPFCGDMLNGDVYPATEVSFVPESQRVGIPDLAVAKSWGYFHP
jgi:hypothetical protein